MRTIFYLNISDNEFKFQINNTSYNTNVYLDNIYEKTNEIVIHDCKSRVKALHNRDL